MPKTPELQAAQRNRSSWDNVGPTQLNVGGIEAAQGSLLERTE
jgi:hypothetical protein